MKAVLATWPSARVFSSLQLMVEQRSKVTNDGEDVVPGFATKLLGRVRVLLAAGWQALKQWSRPDGSVGLGLLTDSLRSRSTLLVKNGLLRVDE